MSLTPFFFEQVQRHSLPEIYDASELFAQGVSLRSPALSFLTFLETVV
jgi:hypothetical protein